MLKNYFLLAWRHLVKNKGYSFINIAGLATGMAIALLIGLWIADETSFDHSHANHARIAQVMLRQVIDRPMSGAPASKEQPITRIRAPPAPTGYSSGR